MKRIRMLAHQIHYTWRLAVHDEWMPYRALHVVIGLSLAAVGATSSVPIKLLWYDIGTPALYYVGTALCIVAAVRPKRVTLAAAGFAVVFLAVNRAIGFYDLLRLDGQTNLWGSITQQVAIAALSLFVTWSAIWRADG